MPAISLGDGQKLFTIHRAPGRLAGAATEDHARERPEPLESIRDRPWALVVERTMDGASPFVRRLPARSPKSGVPRRVALNPTVWTLWYPVARAVRSRRARRRQPRRRRWIQEVARAF